ncbi:MAG TPA: ATP-binding cassette domain-containing protein, partial [Rhodanobacter sp.]|nr:ATP-binding cassette domain-containing protein [Rhodanobacter sp.]
GLYTRLTARENIAYFGRLHGMPETELGARAEALIHALGMDAIADRRAAGFSQGERVKTAIARALVHDPHNVILDEPSNGLDVMATRSLREFMRALRAEGRCVLFSSHVMQEVAALCDRVVIMARGRIVADASPQALREETGAASLEDAFVNLIGSGEGLAA